MYHDETHHGLWNMPVAEGGRDCACSDCLVGQCRTTFDMSPKMGTYQPTFIIHDMDHIEGNISPLTTIIKGIKMNMFAMMEQKYH